MVNGALSLVENSVTGPCQPPAQVNLFHVSKKVFIQSTHFLISISPDKQTSARGPEYGYRIIVLPMIFFKRIKHSAAAKGIAQPIDQASCSAGIVPKQRWQKLL